MQGEFEYCGEERGLPVYRVRWGRGDGRSRPAAADGRLTAEELRRATFIRHLIRDGRISEDSVG